MSTPNQIKYDTVIKIFKHIISTFSDIIYVSLGKKLHVHTFEQYNSTNKKEKEKKFTKQYIFINNTVLYKNIMSWLSNGNSYHAGIWDRHNKNITYFQYNLVPCIQGDNPDRCPPWCDINSSENTTWNSSVHNIQGDNPDGCPQWCDKNSSEDTEWNSSLRRNLVWDNLSKQCKIVTNILRGNYAYRAKGRSLNPNQIVKWKVHIVLMSIIEFEFITTSCTFKTMIHTVLFKLSTSTPSK